MPKNNLWFIRKRYGWGWTPATWQGWVSVGIFAACIGFVVALGMSTSQDAADVLISAVLPALLLTTLLCMLCIEKGESPRWQWGKRR